MFTRFSKEVIITIITLYFCREIRAANGHNKSSSYHTNLWLKKTMMTNNCRVASFQHNKVPISWNCMKEHVYCISRITLINLKFYRLCCCVFEKHFVWAILNEIHRKLYSNQLLSSASVVMSKRRTFNIIHLKIHLQRDLVAQATTYNDVTWNRT